MHRQTIDAYNADARHWLTTRYNPQRHPLPAALRFRDLVGDGLILDLGCGPGQLLGDLGEPAIGIDASAGMLALAREVECRHPLVQADIEVLPIATGSISGAFANFSLQHLPRAGFLSAIREIGRALRSGGHLEIAMHRPDHASGQRDGVRADDDMPIGRWFTYWDADQVVGVLEANGFEMVAVENLEFANRFLASTATQ